MIDQSQRERGGCLSAWLIFMIAANLFSVVSYLFASDNIKEQYPDAPDGVFILLGLLGLVNIGCAIGLWMWQRWGFYGFIGVSIIALIINFGIGVPIAASLLGLVGIAILWYLIKDKWEAFA